MGDDRLRVIGHDLYSALVLCERVKESDFVLR
jgi:hypothetical protein